MALISFGDQKKRQKLYIYSMTNSNTCVLREGVKNVKTYCGINFSTKKSLRIRGYIPLFADRNKKNHLQKSTVIRHFSFTDFWV